MRIIRFFMLYIMVSALGLVVAVFLALNHYPVQIDLIKGQYSVNVAWVMLGAAVFGGVMTMLALLPGRIATGYMRARWRGMCADLIAMWSI